MKWILCCLIFFSTTTYAQTKGKLLTDKLKRTEQMMLGKTAQTKPPVFTVEPNLTIQENEIVSINRPANRIISLPQDNMPCLVPNSELFPMPNRLNSSILTNPIDPGIYLESEPPFRARKSEVNKGH